MSGSATSTLDIILKDDVSAAARGIAASLEKVQAEAKSVDEALAKSGTRDVLQSRLKQLGASKAQIEGVAKAFGDMTKAEGLALDKSKDWTKAQRQQVANWENVAVAKMRADRGLERAREYAAIADARKTEQLDEKAHQRRLQMAAQEAAARHRQEEHLVEQRAHGEAHHGFRNYVLQSAALAVSAHGIMSTIENAIEHGAEYQHRLVALQNSGRTPAEIAEMQVASHAALRGAPTATLTGNLEILNETVGAFGSVEHAIEHLGFMNKAASVLHAVAGDKIGGSAGEMGNQLARFFEMRGTAGNGAVFEREASEMMKSMIFSGGNVNPRELLNFAQQAKSSLQNYSLEFLSRIAPSLIGEVGGDRAGTQANAFNQVIMGKANDAKQAAAWLKYGLIDPKMMTGKGAQKTAWTAGAIYHTDEFLKNPLKAIEERLLPALEKKGVDTGNALELTKVLGTLLRNNNAAAWANELAQGVNRKRLHKDAGYIDDVEDPATIYKRLLKTDPTVALHALQGSLENLLTTVSSPLMETAARSMSGIAENLNGLAIAANDHPAVAVLTGLSTALGSLYAAGKVSYGLLNGFGSSIARGLVTEIEHGVAGAGVAGKVTAAVEGAVQGAVGGVAGRVTGAAGRVVGVEALEIAATGAVTLSAGTVALVGLTAAAIIAALAATTPPKKRASDDPAFGNPFAPGKGIDFNDPNLQANSDDSKKPWFNRGSGAHPRGSLPAFKDTDQPGHWVDGPHGTRHWALEDNSPLRNAPYFSTAPLDNEGHVKGMLHGWIGDRVPVDPSTGSIFGLNRMPTDPRLYQPADVPLPPARPEEFGSPGLPPPAGIERRTFGAYLDAARPEAAAGTMPQAVAPKVDTSPAEEGLMHLMSLSTEAGSHMTEALNVSASPTVNMGPLQSFIALLREAIALQSQLGNIAPGANAAVGARRSMNRTPTGAVTA